MRVKYTKLIFVGLTLLVMIGLVGAGSIDVTSGGSFYATLEGRFLSANWAGLKVINNGINLPESNLPFVSFALSLPLVMEVQFPGNNLKDDSHYYAAMIPSTFNLNNIQNVSVSDLDSEQLFTSAQFPTFYPDYDGKSDNPRDTFCCSTEDISIGGRNFSAFKTTMEPSIDYYLLKYDDSGTATPFFIVKFKDKTCYNNTACVGQFMLPITNSNYNYYILSKYPQYTYRVWIDNVETNTFSQTALPYNLTVEVSDLYTSLIVPDVKVLVAEDAGQNIFIPYKLTGYISTAYSLGLTDADGKETFLVAPTVYPTLDNYSIYMAALIDGFLTSQEELFVSSKDSLVAQSKPLTPSRLYDNSKAAVNAMNQISSYLFKWSSERLEAKKFTITYDRGTDTFTLLDLQTSAPTVTLKTGAPNVITLSVTNFGVPQSGYKGIIQEEDGYLIMNPYTDSSPLDQKKRFHMYEVPTGTEFVVTPTSLGTVTGNATLTILDSGNNVLNSIELSVDSDLNIVSGGSAYNNDLLKTIVNAMNAVIYSLYYSLNF